MSYRGDSAGHENVGTFGSLLKWFPSPLRAAQQPATLPNLTLNGSLQALLYGKLSYP